MISYEEIKTIYCSNIIIFVILVFVIIYLIINRDNLYSNNNWTIDYIKQTEIIKPILITGILFLIFHILFTWDDNNENNQLILEKYKLGQDNKLAQNEIVAANTNLENKNIIPNIVPQSLNNKYRIINNNSNLYDNNLNKLNKISKNSDKISNQNIFISQNKSSKYGIKL